MGDADLKCNQLGIIVLLWSSMISTLYGIQTKISLFFIKHPYCLNCISKI
jgi:hypothetical protein